MVMIMVRLMLVMMIMMITIDDYDYDHDYYSDTYDGDNNVLLYLMMSILSLSVGSLPIES